jgi:hypothetical protein
VANTDLQLSINSIDDMLSADVSEDTSEAWKQDLGDRIEEIIDRKRSSVQGRETTLTQYVHMLMSHYSHDEIESKTSELFPALMKSVKSESSEKETSLALRGSFRSRSNGNNQANFAQLLPLPSSRFLPKPSTMQFFKS